MTIFKFSLLAKARSKGAIITTVLLPLAMILFRPLWVADEVWRQGFYFTGMLIFVGSFVLSQEMITERVDGTIVRILASPTSMLGYFMEKLLAYFVPLLLQVTIIVTLGTVLYDWELIFTLALFLSYTVFILTSIALSIAWSCLFKSKANSFSVFSMIAVFVGILGGFMLPLNMLPDGLRFVGMLFPPYWLSNSIWTLQFYGVEGQYWLSLVILLIFAVVFLVYGGKRRIV
jgi:ABC-2 type transport system permease protein